MRRGNTQEKKVNTVTGPTTHRTPPRLMQGRHRTQPTKQVMPAKAHKDRTVVWMDGWKTFSACFVFVTIPPPLPNGKKRGKIKSRDRKLAVGSQ